MTSAGQPDGGQAPILADLDVLDDAQPHAAAFNMAADEALLESLGRTALLRFYRWERPAVSFGYFDRFEPVARDYPGRDLIRRWTGGGVVEHGQDFTYSLLVPRTHALTDLRADESYRLLHTVVATAIIAAGPGLAPVTAQCSTAGGEETSRACFVNAVRHDLLLDGHKVAGAAQRRTRRGWLHQGSVQLPGNAADVYERLRRTLPSALAAQTGSRRFLSGEKAAADHLVETKYGTTVWLRRF